MKHASFFYEKASIYGIESYFKELNLYSEKPDEWRKYRG